MYSERTWNDNIMDIVRTIFFRDEELKSLMLIPADAYNNIQLFVDKYFLNDPMGEELQTNEKTRVLYYNTEGTDVGNHHVKKKYLEFDVFVKRTERYNASNDGLRGRDKMIVHRINQLLTGKRYAGNMRFTYYDDYELGTKIVGYIRHHIVFSYKTSF